MAYAVHSANQMPLFFCFIGFFFVQILRPKIYIEIENDFMQNKKLLQLD